MNVLFALVLALSAQANDTVESTFLTNSQLPQVLQSKVLKAVKARCHASLANLQEARTSIVETTVDQELEVHYTTILTGTYSLNGYHQRAVAIVVESAEWEIMNPPNPDKNGVQKVSSAASVDGICR